MNDESDLSRLQSITLGMGAVYGDSTTGSKLIMKSMNDNDID